MTLSIVENTDGVIVGILQESMPSVEVGAAFFAEGLEWVVDAIHYGFSGEEENEDGDIILTDPHPYEVHFSREANGRRSVGFASYAAVLRVMQGDPWVID